MTKRADALPQGSTPTAETNSLALLACASNYKIRRKLYEVWSTRTERQQRQLKRRLYRQIRWAISQHQKEWTNLVATGLVVEDPEEQLARMWKEDKQ